MIVDFVYDERCPNVKAARANLMRAFSAAGLAARWTEHQIGAQDAPERVGGYGSPTILVDAVDVAGLTSGAEDCCRLYGAGGVPAVEMIAAALERSKGTSQDVSALPAIRSLTEKRGWRSIAAVLPAIGIGFMPKVICPLCWPAYAGLLSAAGLTFLMEDRWLLPISALCLLAALAALAWKARSRRGYGPLALGTLSSAAILFGKFATDSNSLAYAGIAMLVTSCTWNAWPRRVIEPACGACRAPNAN